MASRNAYALLGLSFAIVFGGAYILMSQPAQAPTPEDVSLPVNLNTEDNVMKLTSTAFAEGEFIPAKYTCDGDNLNPPLEISEIPESTQSLVLVMDDPDIPEEIKTARGIKKFDHWAVANIDPTTTSIPENWSGGSLVKNSRGEAAYTGPCPPPEYEPTTHRYIFRLYALREPLNPTEFNSLDELEAAAQTLMITSAELMGRYTRVTE